MHEDPPQPNPSDRQALEDLVIDNRDLERLENRDQFNIFEAIGMVKQEIKHSAFLKFLLDPNDSHGMGEIFLKRLLQKVLTRERNASRPIDLINLDVWDLEDTTVSCESHNIDILILNKINKLVVIIENKIDSTEHSDQLRRYWKIIETRYPDWHRMGLYLTPDGRLPINEEMRIHYLSINYAILAELIDELLERRATVLGPDVKTLLTHYRELIRRHIMSDSEIDELCRRIYKRHKRALDLIFERLPDQQMMIKEEIEKMIKTTPDFAIDVSNKTEIRFVPKTWDVPILQKGVGWGRFHRILMFHFENTTEGVRLLLTIGPGDSDTRQRLFDMASSHGLVSPGKSFSDKWSRIYSEIIVKKKDLEERDIEEVYSMIHSAWKIFRTTKLLEIENIMKSSGVL